MDGPITFSVVISTCDRRDSLRALLEALEHQTWPHFEVVVVVGPTRDDSRAMLVDEFAGRALVLDCPEFNLSVARNLGLSRARGEVVAFVDDDAVPAPRWLEQLAEAYAADPTLAGAGGRTYDVRPDVGHLQFLHGLFSALGDQQDVLPHPWVELEWRAPQQFRYPRFHGTNMSYRRSALIEIGGFDERYEYLFDDADIAVRLRLAGHRLAQLERGTVYHVPGTGRNRGPGAYDLNWYCWLRSTIYFTLKNGGPTIGWRPALASARRHLSTMNQRVAGLAAAGALSEAGHLRARGMIRRAAVHGLAQGLFGRRRLAASICSPRASRSQFSARDRRPPAASPRVSPSAAQRPAVAERALSIALLSIDYPPRSTHGVARSTRALARGLAQLGHEVHVITHGAGRRVRLEDGVFVREVDGFGQGRFQRFTAGSFPNLARWLAHSQAVHEEIGALRIDHRPQVVDTPLWHLDGLITALEGELPVVVRAVTAMKQITAVHSSPSAEATLFGELETDLLTRSAGVISNTEATAESLSRLYGYRRHGNAGQHSVVLYGLEPVAESEVFVRDQTRSGEVTVLFVGRLEGRKGVLDLFEAIPWVLARRPRTRFVIAGEDNSRNDGFFERQGMDYPTFFRSRHHEVAHKVDFAGHVTEERLVQLYRECDLFVAPSLYESFGLIYLEAMNHGRPAIGCRAGGPTEIIVDGETGLLVSPQDPEQLSEAILRLADDAELRHSMGRAGRARFLERFTHHAMARGFAEHYRQVIANGRRAASETRGMEMEQ